MRRRICAGGGIARLVQANFVPSLRRDDRTDELFGGRVSGPAPILRGSASGLQLCVHLADESIARHPDFLHLRIEIGGHLGRHDLVFALALSQ
jgi:hypothetical protein